MNDFIEDLINDWAGHIAAVDAVMKLAATDLIYLVLPLAFALWFVPGVSAERALRQRVWLAIMISVIAGLLLATLVSQLYSDARPFDVPIPGFSSRTLPTTAFPVSTLP